MHPDATAFLDPETSYAVGDPAGSSAAVIDSVPAFDYASGHTGAAGTSAPVDFSLGVPVTKL